MKTYYKIDEFGMFNVMKVDFCCKDIEESLGFGYIHGNDNKIYLKDKTIHYCPFCGKGIIFIERR